MNTNVWVLLLVVVVLWGRAEYIRIEKRHLASQQCEDLSGDFHQSGTRAMFAARGQRIAALD
jgi:hypothetical protein